MKNSLSISNLKCEYSERPIGIDVINPRLSWILESDLRGQMQSAYQILVSTTEEKLLAGIVDMWDSGVVHSSETFQISYQGHELISSQRVWWKVRVWDQEGNPGDYSHPAYWETGLLNRKDWSAKWIGARLRGGPRTTIPVPFFRRSFNVGKKVTRARLYITSLGLYEVQINGKKVGDDILTPGWTDYNTRVQYQTYDISESLTMGENVIGAILADGWYCGHVGWRDRQYYGYQPKIFAQMVLIYEDGEKEVIHTDTTWKYSFGPILEADLQMGESYDARLEFLGWSEPGYDDKGWTLAECFDDPDVKIVAQCGPSVRRIQEIQPVSEPVKIEKWPVSHWIFNMGQNMVGRVRIKVKGEAGTTVRLRFGEMLNPDGTLYTENLRRALQTDYYTMRGGVEEIYEPRFTFHGFQYVELSGFPGIVNAEMITGVVLHSNTEPTGKFECSDSLINQLQHNITWGQKGNFVDVPTDCPQRDERLGWTGDAQVFVRTAAFNMDVAGFFTRWTQVLEDSQSSSGQYPMVAPKTSDWEVDGGPAWADAGIICPWTIYQCYGDRRILETHYESMSRFIHFLETTSESFIRTYSGYSGFMGFGDWLSINADTPRDLIGTAFFAYSTNLMEKIAGVLGKNEDRAHYFELFKNIQRAFIERFITPAGLVAGQTQTAYILALYFDLIPQKLRDSAVNALVADIKLKNMHLSTGFVGAPYLPFVLSQAGKWDIVFGLLNQKSWPSWLYAVTQGATTIWERWDGWTQEKGFQDPGMNSFNHYAYGSIGEWLYSVVAGIGIDPDFPGYRSILLSPNVGGGLTQVKAELLAMTGKIVSFWKIEGNNFIYDVHIPANTTALVEIPTKSPATISESGNMANVKLKKTLQDRVVFEIGGGSYTFTTKFNTHAE